MEAAHFQYCPNQYHYGTICAIHQTGVAVLRLSKLCDYAIVIMSYLAACAKGVHSAKDIAAAVHLTQPTVSKLLKLLQEAKLVISCRGTGGGYQLAREAGAISVQAVVEAIEGGMAITTCCSKDKNCSLSSACTVRENWRVINQFVFSTLSRISMHDMIHPQRLRELMMQHLLENASIEGITHV